MSRAKHRARPAAPVEKGFLTGEPDGGVHAHVLEREYKRTAVDGAHRHAFTLPDGRTVMTNMDGEHGHGVTEWGQADGGSHVHTVDVDGVTLRTSMSGWHGHDLQVETTAFDGVHNHELVLTGGHTICSMLPEEQWLRGGRAMPAMAKAADSEEHRGTAALRFAGEQAFLDIRLDAGADRRIGWSFEIGRGFEAPATVAEGEALAKRWSPHGDRCFRALTDRCLVVLMDESTAAAEPFDGERDENGHLVKSLGEFTWEHGLHEPAIEVFIKGGPLAGRLVVDDKTGLLATGVDIGCHLVKAARAPSHFAIPSSVRKALGDISLTHEAWCDSGLLDHLAVVGGEILPIAKKVSYHRRDPGEPLAAMTEFLELAPEGVTIASPLAGDGWRDEMEKSAAGQLLVLDPPDGAAFPPDRLVRLVKDRECEWLLVHDDTPAAREAFEKAGRPFKLAVDALADRLFVASWSVPAFGDVRFVTAKRTAEPAAVAETPAVAPPVQQPTEAEQIAALEKRLEGARLIAKADSTDEERFVYGVVLEPDGVDAQNDTVSPEEIRKAAHEFMATFKNIGLQHQTFINGRAQILESYIAPVDFELGGEAVKKGTWMFGVRVIDEQIWKAVKSGSITGFSIGGSAVRQPV